MTICERMFEVMDQRDITAYALCQKTGLSNSTLSNWRSRNTDPPAKYLIPICEILGCSVNYLLTGKDEAAGIYTREDAIHAWFAPHPSTQPQNWSIRDRIEYMLGLILEREDNLLRAVGISPGSREAEDFSKGDFSVSLVVPICKFLGCSLEYLLTGQETEKAPAPGMSENGREMLELYEQLPEREQLLLLGRLQEMTSPVSSDVKGGSEAAGSSAGRAG